MSLVFFLLYHFIFFSNNPMVTRVSLSYAHPDVNFRRCIWELTELRYTYNVTRIRGRFKDILLESTDDATSFVKYSRRMFRVRAFNK